MPECIFDGDLLIFEIKGRRRRTDVQRPLGIFVIFASPASQPTGGVRFNFLSIFAETLNNLNWFTFST